MPPALPVWVSLPSAMAESTACSPKWMEVHGFFTVAVRTGAIAGRSIAPVPIYRAVEKAEVAGLDALQGQVAVVHSPRLARRLAELIDPVLRATVRIAAISAAAAEAAGDGWEEVRAARAPNDTDLLALCARLCET